jgi:hypothetical protein
MGVELLSSSLEPLGMAGRRAVMNPAKVKALGGTAANLQSGLKVSGPRVVGNHGRPKHDVCLGHGAEHGMGMAPEGAGGVQVDEHGSTVLSTRLSSTPQQMSCTWSCLPWWHSRREALRASRVANVLLVGGVASAVGSMRG